MTLWVAGNEKKKRTLYDTIEYHTFSLGLTLLKIWYTLHIFENIPPTAKL